jgi:hypothetical protein
MPVVSTPRPRAGDIFLSLQGADPALGPEGYGLNVGDVAEVRGTTEAGVFYGTQTLLQILKTVPGHRALPRGSARDWPQQRERGFLLDAGRKYYSPDFIVQAIREMSYLKLNTLQIHFSDNDGRASGVHEGRHQPLRGGRAPLSRDDHPGDRDAGALGGGLAGSPRSWLRLPADGECDGGRDQARGTPVRDRVDR